MSNGYINIKQQLTFTAVHVNAHARSVDKDSGEAVLREVRALQPQVVAKERRPEDVFWVDTCK